MRRLLIISVFAVVIFLFANVSGNIVPTIANNSFLPILPAQCLVSGMAQLLYENETLVLRNLNGAYVLDRDLNVIKSIVNRYSYVDDGSTADENGLSTYTSIARSGNDRYANLWMNDSGKEIIINNGLESQLAICGSKGDRITRITTNKDKSATLQILDLQSNVLSEHTLPQSRYSHFSMGKIMFFSMPNLGCLVINVENGKSFSNTRSKHYSKATTKGKLLLYGGWLLNMDTMEPVKFIDGNANFCTDKVIFWDDVTGDVFVVNPDNGEIIQKRSLKTGKTLNNIAVSNEYVFGYEKGKCFFVRNIESDETVARWAVTDNNANTMSNWAFDGSCLYFNFDSCIYKIDMKTGKTVLTKPLPMAFDAKMFGDWKYIQTKDTGNVTFARQDGIRFVSTTLYTGKPFWKPLREGILLLPLTRQDAKSPVLLTLEGEKKLEGTVCIENEFVQAWNVDENGKLLTIWSNGDIFRIDDFEFTKLWNFKQFALKKEVWVYSPDIYIAGSSYGCCVYGGRLCMFTDYKNEVELAGKNRVWKDLLFITNDNSTFFSKIVGGQGFKKLCDLGFIGSDENRMYFANRYSMKMLSFDGVYLYEMPTIASNSASLVKSWGSNFFGEYSCANVSKDTRQYWQLFYNDFAWTSISPCNSLALQGNALFEWSPCPTFTIKRKGQYTFEFTSNRKDDLSDKLNAKVAIFQCQSNGTEPELVYLDNWKNIPLTGGNRTATVSFDKSDFSSSWRGSKTKFMLVIESNGLLDTQNSELSDFDKDDKPLFDGIPISYDQQKSVVITVWDSH